MFLHSQLLIPLWKFLPNCHPWRPLKDNSTTLNTKMMWKQVSIASRDLDYGIWVFRRLPGTMCSRFSTRVSPNQARRVFQAASSDETSLDKASLNSPAEAPVAPLRTDESPFDRFRGFNRGLSVTDLLSNTWCEQQFEYYLVRGKKRRTPAMKAGTKIHKKLEREVHETVIVDTDTPEDRFGLKLLNIIQGLKTLRETGMTRELPVFALVRGMFIQGVIDEISYTKPIEKVYSVRDEPSSAGEDDVCVKLPKKRGRKKKGENEANSDDLKKQQSLMSNFIAPILIKANLNVAYISDCKTRLRDSLPTVSQFQGAELQLMLYHFLLTRMASSVQSAAEIYSRSSFSSASAGKSANVTCEDLFSQLFAARKLDPHANFTDRFLAQMAPLLDESDLEMDSDSITSPEIVRFPTLTHILDNPTLSGLVQLLNIAFFMSIPSLSNTLAVSYRSQQSSRLLATKTVEYNTKRMEAHLDQVLQWWQGQRVAEGVPIEEAWKCRSCEFADECEWRLQKIMEIEVENKRKKQNKLGKGKKSAVSLA
ncbi:exonuclease V a 5' deoxyribonuclease-domain-containing protein [Tirmania nivea]|nr:exonuclease V a 5' deoxyribonuclease-domain-containing protein [Tirmania nivea]